MNLVHQVLIHVLDWCVAYNVAAIDSISTYTQHNDTQIDQLYSIVEPRHSEYNC